MDDKKLDKEILVSSAKPTAGLKSPHMWLDRPIADPSHAKDLETDAAINEFGHRMPREKAEAAAYDKYVLTMRHKAAAHHLAGSRAALASGDEEAARKHGAMYKTHVEALGHEPVGQVPPEVLKEMENPQKVYKFKAHRGDLFALDKKEQEGLAKTSPFDHKDKDLIHQLNHGFRGEGADKAAVPQVEGPPSRFSQLEVDDDPVVRAIEQQEQLPVKKRIFGGRSEYLDYSHHLPESWRNAGHSIEISPDEQEMYHVGPGPWSKQQQGSAYSQHWTNPSVINHGGKINRADVGSTDPIPDTIVRALTAAAKQHAANPTGGPTPTRFNQLETEPDLTEPKSIEPKSIEPNPSLPTPTNNPWANYKRTSLNGARLSWSTNMAHKLLAYDYSHHLPENFEGFNLKNHKLTIFHDPAASLDDENTSYWRITDPAKKHIASGTWSPWFAAKTRDGLRINELANSASEQHHELRQSNQLPKHGEASRFSLLEVDKDKKKRKIKPTAPEQGPQAPSRFNQLEVDNEPGAPAPARTIRLPGAMDYERLAARPRAVRPAPIPQAEQKPELDEGTSGRFANLEIDKTERSASGKPKARPCVCQSYLFPHRTGSGRCGAKRR